MAQARVVAVNLLGMRPRPAHRDRAGEPAVEPRRTSGAVVQDGFGDPVTVFASGGFGGGNFEGIRHWGAGVRGTRAFFRYGGIEPWAPGRPPRRGAERDAAELRAAADQSGATCAVGMSRGTCALLGVLADDTARFDRVVLVIPPAGTAAGRYREWLGELPVSAATPVTSADILILAMRGDSGHPVKVAEDWSNRLGTPLEVFPSTHRLPNVLTVMAERCQDFLNQPRH